MNDKNIIFKIRNKCAVCESPLKSPLIDLPHFPLTELYTKVRPRKLSGYVDQKFYLCQECGHGQLGHIIAPQFLYTATEYFFRTSQSKSASTANDVFLQFILDTFKSISFETIIEIGCSDLYLLQALKKCAKKLIGIDPILKGHEKELSDSKIKVIGDFFENIDIRKEIFPGKSVVISSHTLEHVENPKQMLLQLLANLGSDTLYIFQFPGFETLISDGRYDQIFHQHLQYFSLDSFTYLLHLVGAEVINYKINYRHWGSLMIAFGKAKRKTKLQHRSVQQLTRQITVDYDQFKKQMKLFKKYISEIRKEPLYGFGAALMLPILGYYLDSDLSEFNAILDDDTQKSGLHYINLRTQIKNPQQILNLKQANVVVTALNTGRSILPRVLSLQPKRIIFPIQVL